MSTPPPTFRTVGVNQTIAHEFQVICPEKHAVQKWTIPNPPLPPPAPFPTRGVNQTIDMNKFYRTEKTGRYGAGGTFGAVGGAQEGRGRGRAGLGGDACRLPPGLRGGLLAPRRRRRESGEVCCEWVSSARFC